MMTAMNYIKGKVSRVLLSAVLLCLSISSFADAAQSINLGPFNATVSSASFTYSKTAGMKINLDLLAGMNIAGHSMDMSLKGLTLTDKGIADATVSVEPASGSGDILNVTLFEGANMTVSGATIDIKDNKAQSVVLAASIDVEGMGLKTTNLTESAGAWSATLVPIDKDALSIAGVKLGLQSDSVITLNISSSNSFEIAFTNVEFDFSAIAGTDFKILIDRFTYENGNITVDTGVSKQVTVDGVSMDIQHLQMTSAKPAAGASRVLTALLNGTLTVDVVTTMTFGFSNFTISSNGQFGGDITPPHSGEFNMFGFTFEVTKLHLAKPSGGGLTFSMDGNIGSGVDFTNLTISGGKLSGDIIIPSNSPLQGPWSEFVSISKIEIANNDFSFDGFLELPAPLSKKLPVNGVKLGSNGKPETISLSNVNIPIDKFNLDLSAFSFDFNTETINMSGDLGMPSGTLSAPLNFSNLKFSLANVGSGGKAQPDSSGATSNTKTTNDTKHNLNMSISDFSFGMDPSKSMGGFFVNLSGTMTVEIDGSGFDLHFTNFKICSDGEYSIGTVTGGIKLAGYGIDVTQYTFDDSGSDPSYTISGNLTFPEIGELDVKKLQIFKSGLVQLEGITISMEYPAYAYEISVSYVNKVFSGSGTLTFGGKGIEADATFGPGQWGVDISVEGLEIELFAGVTLYSIGGGVHYWEQKDGTSNLYEFSLTSGLGFPERDVLYSDVELDVYTNGNIDIDVKDLKMFDSVNIGNASININIPNETLSGTLHLGEYMGPVYTDVTLNTYISPSNWYLSGNGTAKLFNKSQLQMGSASFRLDNNGFRTQGNMNFGVGVAGNVNFSFDFTTNKSGVSTGHLTGNASVDLSIVTANGTLTADYDGNNDRFTGSLYLSGCINVCWPGCSWHWVQHCCCSYKYCCEPGKHWYNSCRGHCWDSVCASTYDSYNCSSCYSQTSSCASKTINLRIDSGGVNVSY